MSVRETMRLDGEWVCVPRRLFNNQLRSLPESMASMFVNGDLLMFENRLTSLPDAFGHIKLSGDL